MYEIEAVQVLELLYRVKSVGASAEVFKSGDGYFILVNHDWDGNGEPYVEAVFVPLDPNYPASLDPCNLTLSQMLEELPQ